MPLEDRLRSGILPAARSMLCEPTLAVSASSDPGNPAIDVTISDRSFSFGRKLLLPFDMDQALMNGWVDFWIEEFLRDMTEALHQGG